jgi:hypothetical protein
MPFTSVCNLGARSDAYLAGSVRFSEHGGGERHRIQLAFVVVLGSLSFVAAPLLRGYDYCHRLAVAW